MKNREMMIVDHHSIQINKALVGMAMGPADEPLFAYLDFLKEVLPIRHIIAVHVISKSSLATVLPVADLKFVEMLEYDRRERCKELLRKVQTFVKEQLTGPGPLQIKCLVLEGSPLETIEKLAASHQADLLIVGRRGMDGQHKVLAKNLIRHVKGNTLIIPDKARTRLRRVLVPVDFSGNSKRALTLALGLKKTLNRTIEIQAINIYQRPGPIPATIDSAPDRLEADIRDNQRKAFNAFIQKEFSGDAKEITPILLDNDSPGIARQLLSYVRENEIDLVVMGAKGHSRLQVLLLGSVTEKFLDFNGEVPTWIVN